MRFHLQLVAETDNGHEEPLTVTSVERSDDLSIDTLGLNLEEAKSILAAVQMALTDAQAHVESERQRACPCCGEPRKLKDRRTIKVRTLFGKISVPSPRYRRCPCETPGVTAPLVSALPERVTPELLALEAKWASLMAYGATVKLLGDVLPIDEATNAQTIRNDVLGVAERLEAELGPEKAFFASVCQRDLNEMPLPDPPVMVGMDGGYVRDWTDRPNNFEVIVGKSVPEEGPSRRFGFVVGHDEKPKRRLHELLEDQGIAMNQEVTFLSDGADNLRDLQLYMRPNAEHILDWFHITMRVTVLQQTARGLPPPLDRINAKLVEFLDRIRWCIWNGNVALALERIELLEDTLGPMKKTVKKVRKLCRKLEELGKYIAANASLIPNYAERHRYGEVVSTAFAESAVNQIVSKRFAKKQQMQWTPRGVHLLMQLRTRVLDGTLEDDFKRWKNERINIRGEKIAA